MPQQASGAVTQVSGADPTVVPGSLPAAEPVRVPDRPDLPREGVSPAGETPADRHRLPDPAA